MENAPRNAHTDQFGTEKIASHIALKVRFTETSNVSALSMALSPPETNLAASSGKCGMLRKAFALAMATFSAKNHALKSVQIFSLTSSATNNVAKRA